MKRQSIEWKEIFANHIQVSSLHPSVKVSFMPLCFYEITTSLTIFANGKKSKEDFHFYGERGKAKIMFTTCFAASNVYTCFYHFVSAVRGSSTPSSEWHCQTPPQEPHSISASRQQSFELCL